MDNTYFVAASWMGLALLASLVSIRLGISVALLEIGMGVIGGNFLGLHTTPWIDPVCRCPHPRRNHVLRANGDC